MAEFQEVCKQFIRRHAMLDNALGAKTRAVWVGISATGEKTECGDGYIAYSPEVLESEIMQWAAAHPEAVYPTWVEWQKANFPDAKRSICMRCFAGNEVCDAFDSCTECLDCPIPADIAEKLGIKPIGGKE